jgi:hypothetical protein
MKRMSASYYRGDKPQFYPEDKTLARDSVVDRFLVKGWMPESAFISTAAPIVAFGSCFAANISNYLHERGYNVITKKEGKAYITKMGDGMVHTHAIRQQFEWRGRVRFQRANFGRVTTRRNSAMMKMRESRQNSSLTPLRCSSLHWA